MYVCMYACMHACMHAPGFDSRAIRPSQGTINVDAVSK